MHAGVVVVQVQPGKEDEAIRLYQAELVPVLQQQSGYQGGYLLVNRGTGQAITIGLWESEDQARAFETSGMFQAALATFANLIVARPIRELYEVAVQV